MPPNTTYVPYAAAKSCRADAARVGASATALTSEAVTVLGFSTLRKSLQPAVARIVTRPTDFVRLNRKAFIWLILVGEVGANEEPSRRREVEELRRRELVRQGRVVRDRLGVGPGVLRPESEIAAPEHDRRTLRPREPGRQRGRQVVRDRQLPEPQEVGLRVIRLVDA